MSEVTKKSAAYLVATSVVFTSVAQLLFSFAMKGAGEHEADAAFGIFAIVTTLSTSDLLIVALGVLLYALSMLAWIFALTRFPVSLAYPMLSISYVLVYFVATSLPVLNETGSIQELLGVAFVVLGISTMFFGEDA